MAFFKNNFWGDKNAGFDLLYHNMKHGQIATKELAEFVRERAAIEETYSKSMSKMAKMASNGSSLGTFAPMWDVFRVSSDKLALCHLELMRKMNDLIRDINKYGDEQVKVHRKTKEEQVATLESVQAVQVQNGHLQKSREGYHSKCIELDRLRKEGAPQKELEKAELKSKKAAELFAVCIEKYNRVGGDFEQKMSESAQKFQDIEEAHLRQIKQLIKGYSHSIEDTHVQVGQVHEEFKQNVENIGIDNLIQRFSEQKGTGKDPPALVGFEEYMTASVPEGSKKSRGKAFRIPGLGKRDKEPDSTDLAVTETPNSPLEVDEEGFVIRADVNQNGCSTEDKENDFYSSDSDFDDEEPKKFHIQIRPVGSSSNSAATEMELKATMGALTLPPNRGVSVKRHRSRNSSTTGRSEGEGEGAPHREGEQDGLRNSISSPDHSRLSSTASGSDNLFGPPLESAFKSKSFAGREQLPRAESVFGASEYAAFSTDSSSPEDVEDSGLDSPSHQPLGPSPETAGWAAWPSAGQSKEPAGLGRPADPFLTAFRDPCPGRSPHPPPRTTQPVSGQLLLGTPAPLQTWTSQPSASRSSPSPCSLQSWTRLCGAVNTSLLKTPSRLPLRGPSSLRRPYPPLTPGPPHLRAPPETGGGSMPNPSPYPSQKKELVHWNSVHNPFSEGTSAGSLALGGVVNEGGRKQRESCSESEPRRSGLPLTLHSGPQEDLCFSTDKDQNCLDLNAPQQSCNMGSHKGSRHSFRQHSAELLVAAPPRPARAKRSSGRLSGCERSRSVCSSPLPDPSLDFTSSSSSSPSEWGPQTHATSPARVHLSRGPSPISLSTQESWPVAAAITEYINAYFKGGQHNRCLVKITGDLTMSFPAGITCIFTANPNAPVLSFRLVNISRVDHFLPNQKLLYSDPSQSDPDTRDFWFNMQALNLYLQREAELNPLASYYNVALLKYQVSSQDPGRAPLLLSAECQRSGTVTRVSLDYHCCPATAPSTQLTAVQVLLPLDHTATDLQCHPPACWNTKERRLLWKLPNLSPTNQSKGSGTLCASWQCLEVPRSPPPSLAVQFVGSGASLSGMDVELVGNHYRMSLVKKRFATGKYMAGCTL
uniref:F-BAR domain only protein 1-like n=1 Tax=Oncorhynchus gorbuscha TaxID=8017 RepID=UPI001EAF0591|nr:F-BAR domain only protein 1-like [Oncorhynchus gorbuscha]